MRMVGYLNGFASRLPDDHKTLVVIDRALAEAGLRRKGQGRAIPTSTLTEDLLLTLAVVGRRSVVTATDDACEWAHLPCISGYGEFFANRKHHTLLSCLTDLCEAIAQGAQVGDFLVEFNLTRFEASIDFLGTKKPGHPIEHLYFDVPGVKPGRQGERIFKLRGDFFVHLSQFPRDSEAEV